MECSGPETNYGQITIAECAAQARLDNAVFFIYGKYDHGAVYRSPPPLSTPNTRPLAHPVPLVGSRAVPERADSLFNQRPPSNSGVSYRPATVGYRSAAVGYSPTAVGYSPTAVGYSPTAISWRPTAISCSSSSIFGVRGPRGGKVPPGAPLPLPQFRPLHPAPSTPGTPSG